MHTLFYIWKTGIAKWSFAQGQTTSPASHLRSPLLILCSWPCCVSTCFSHQGLWFWIQSSRHQALSECPGLCVQSKHLILAPGQIHVWIVQKNPKQYKCLGICSKLWAGVSQEHLHGSRFQGGFRGGRGPNMPQSVVWWHLDQNHLGQCLDLGFDSSESGHRGNLPQHNKRHIQQTQS